MNDLSQFDQNLVEHCKTLYKIKFTIGAILTGILSILCFYGMIKKIIDPKTTYNTQKCFRGMDSLTKHNEENPDNKLTEKNFGNSSIPCTDYDVATGNCGPGNGNSGIQWDENCPLPDFVEGKFVPEWRMYLSYKTTTNSYIPAIIAGVMSIILAYAAHVSWRTKDNEARQLSECFKNLNQNRMNTVSSRII